MDPIDATLKLPTIDESKENGGGEGEDRGGFSGKKETIPTYGKRLDEPKMDQYSLMSLKSQSVMDLGARPKTTLWSLSGQFSTGTNQEKWMPYHRRRDGISQDGSDRMADLFIDTEEKEKIPKEAIYLGNTDPLRVHISKPTQIETVTMATTYEAQPVVTMTTEVKDKHSGSKDRLREISDDLNDSNNSTSTQTAQSERTSNMDIASNITIGATGGQIYQEEQAIWTSSNLSGSSTSLQSELPDPYDKDIREKMNKQAMMEKLPESEQDALKLPMKANLAEKARGYIDLVQWYETLQLMKEDCDIKLKEKNKRDNNLNRKQVVSVAIFFEEELELLRLIPPERRKLFFNQTSSDTIDGYTLSKKNELHGEITFIYIEGAIQALMEKFCSNRNGTTPIEPLMFIYSTYIPCSGLRFMEYNCAEEIGKIGNLYKHECKVVLGYSDSFKFTDKKLALNFLSKSEISSVLEFKPNRFEWIFPNHQQKRKLYLFQKQLFSLICLKIDPCDFEVQGNIAFEVNNFVHQFASREDIKSFGAISTLTLNMIGQFLLKTYTPYNHSLKLIMMESLVDMMGQDRPSPNKCLQFGQPITGSLTDREWQPIKDMEKKRWCNLKMYLNPVDPPNMLSPKIKKNSFDPFRSKKETDQFGIYKQQVTKVHDQRGQTKAKIRKVKAYSSLSSANNL